MNPNNQYINRSLERKLKICLNKKKVIVIYGARQTGKTTLLKNFFNREKIPYLYLSCEEKRIQDQLVPDHLVLSRILGNYKNIILDEAQKLPDPGLILKILIDNYPFLNIIASGSSSFDLANKLTEPLTGRHYQFQLYPFSFTEIKNTVLPSNFSFYWQEALIYGSYPAVFTQKSHLEKIETLTSLTSDYLYRDILSFNLVKNSAKIHDLLVALALQIGNEVSYNELANLLSIDYKTVERYIDLLEKSFIIFRLRAFSRNLRSELNRKVKIYFYDLGVRNCLLNNFSPLHLRPDKGVLFENYFVVEKIKSYQEKGRRPNIYFWRTYDQKEIDFIEEIDGKITAYEIKWQPPKKLRKTAYQKFFSTYPKTEIITITKDNLENFI